MPDVKYSFYRGDTSGIEATPLRDGQILFDQEAKKISLDSKINGQLSRIDMEKDVMQGATASENGNAGFAPQPLAGDQNKVLKGDGTWGALSGSYTPAGTVTVTEGADATTSVTPFGTAGTLPTATWTISGETATFSFNAGTLPSAGVAVDVVTASGARTASFVGTQATITVE